MCVHYQLRGMSCRTTVCKAFQGQDIWKKNYYYYSASLGSYSGLKVKLLFYTMLDRLMWTVVHDQSSWLMNPGSWAVIMNVHDLGSHATGSWPTLSMQSHCWYEFVRMHHHPELFTLPPSLLHHDRNVYAHPGSHSSNGRRNYHKPKRDILAQQEHATSGWDDGESMRQCWAFLDLTGRSFSAVIKELDGDLARTVSKHEMSPKSLSRGSGIQISPVTSFPHVDNPVRFACSTSYYED